MLVPRRAAFLLAMGVSFLVIACAAPAPPPPAAAPTPTPAAGPVPFSTVASGTVGRYEQPGPFLALAGDEAAFRQLWNEHVRQDDPAAALQKIDFGKQVAAVVFYGRRPTGGFGIAVQNAVRNGGRVVITVQTREPVPGALLPQVISSPWEAIALDRAALPNWEELHYVVVNTAGATLAEADP